MKRDCVEGTNRSFRLFVVCSAHPPQRQFNHRGCPAPFMLNKNNQTSAADSCTETTQATEAGPVDLIREIALEIHIENCERH